MGLLGQPLSHGPKAEHNARKDASASSDGSWRVLDGTPSMRGARSADAAGIIVSLYHSSMTRVVHVGVYEKDFAQMTLASPAA